MMKHLIMLLISLRLLTSIHSALKPFSREYPARASLSHCVIEASKLYFRHGEVLNYVLPSEYVPTNKSSPVVLNTILLPALFQQGKWPIVIHKLNDNQKTLDPSQYESYGNYIMQIQNVQNLSDCMEFLRLQLSWNPNGRFIVVALIDNDNGLKPDSPVVQIMDALWMYNVLNGVLILPQEDNSVHYNVLTWFPYEDGACGNDLGHFRIIDVCTNGNNTSSNETWFPDKLPRTFNQCSLQVRTIEYPPFVFGARKIPGTEDEYEIEDGIEIYLVEHITEVLDLQPVFTMSGVSNDWGTVSIEHDGTGIVGNLVNYEDDLAVGSITVTLEIIAVLDVSNAYIIDALNYCVPRSEKTSRWRRFMQILKLDAWIGIVLTVLALSYVIYRFSLSEKIELNMYKSFGVILLRMFAVTLGAAGSIQPRSTKVRYFMMQWIIFSLILDTAFQTFLTSVLTQPGYEPQIQSVEELLESELHILVLDVEDRFYKNPTNQQGANIMARLERCYNLDNCLSRAATMRDSAVITQRLYANFAANKYRTKDGTALLYCFEDSIVTFPIAMMFQKGFPLQNRMSKIVDTVVSAGFINLWLNSIFSKVMQTEFMAEEMADSQKTITMSQLTVAYYIYVAGMATSLLAFSCEMASRWFLRHFMLKTSKAIILYRK